VISPAPEVRVPALDPPQPPADPSAKLDGRRRLVTWGALAALFICFASDQLRAVFAYGRLATDEDQTLLWYAGRELVHFHLHEPNFYGQNYNTIFEALPGELLHLAGLSLALASPLGSALMATGCWLVLAWAARRRGHRKAAVAALALPVCLSVPYLLLFDAPRGVLSGDLAGVMAVAAALVIRRPRRRLAVLIALGGLAIAWENAVALAVIPALAAITASDFRALVHRPRRTMAAAGGALLVPAGWLGIDHLWYQSHPVDLTAPTVNTKLQVSALITNLSHPGRLFGFYEPQLWQQAAVPLAAIVVFLTLAIATGVTRRRPEAAAAAIALLATLLVLLSVRDTLYVRPDLYLSGSRFLLPMPFGLWVVLYFTLSDSSPGVPLRPRSELLGRLLLGGMVALALASWTSGQASFPAQLRAVSAADTAAHPVIPVYNPYGLLAQCAALSRIYAREHAQLLVTYERVVAYGCAADQGLNTLDANYDRRGWLLRAAAVRPLTRILVHGWTCRSISRRAGQCQATGHGTVLLSTPLRPPSISLGLGGIPIRGATAPS
jgi:hypothetical protein